jgi:hypothetical protein
VGPPLLVSRNGGDTPRWIAGGNELIYGTPDTRALMSVQVIGNPTFPFGEPRLQGRLEFLANAGGGDTTADGKRILSAMPVKESALRPLIVVINWPALLKK